MRRYLPPVLIVAAALSQPLTAFAQEGNCPPGAWFCPGDEAAPQAPADASDDSDALPPPPPPPEALPVPSDEPVAPPARTHRHGQPPVVVYQPAPSASPPPQVIIIAPGGTHVVRKTAPQPRVRRAPAVVRRSRTVYHAPVLVPARRARWQSEWGLNVRLQGVSFGGDRHREQIGGHDSSVGGFGLSLRYRPSAHFAFDAGIDVLGGTDFNGFDRVETPFSLSGMVYLNPRSRSQLYLMGGVHWSQASVQSSVASPLLTKTENGDFTADYRYFGGQFGVGLEFRLAKRLSFNVDLLGFIRKRTDVNDWDRGEHGKHDGKDSQTSDRSNSAPEFIDPVTGRTTNMSGGALFRGGLTFWW